jgi:hypothetical protein
LFDKISAMKGTVAICSLLLAVVFGAVLLLPPASLSAGGAPPSGCSCCQSVAPGLESGCGCCRQTDRPGHCGASGQGGSFGCRCAPGSLAFIFSPGPGGPTWQVSDYVIAKAEVTTNWFFPHIFRPPELDRFSS